MTMEQRCIDFANDLHHILKGEPIPSHEHWNKENCDNLLNLIAAFARKHVGDLDKS